MKNTVTEKIKAVMLGHAVADALGVPVEFKTRGQLDGDPVQDMLGFGTYPVPAGAWSDDTSMSVCALDVLADGECDYDRIMVNFGRWYYGGEFTPTGETFDIGNTCRFAIDNYSAYKKPYTECGMRDEASNGNGSLMRIHPFVLYTEYAQNCGESSEVIDTVSALTHAHRRSQIGCGIYAFILRELLGDPRKEAVFTAIAKAKKYYGAESEAKHYERLFAADFQSTDRDDIRSSGYVVDTLEAALWCLLNTDSYEECVLNAVNLGSDTDTVAAVAGGLAGAMYGIEAIPQKWLDTLIKREYIEDICERAAKTWTAEK